MLLLFISILCVCGVCGVCVCVCVRACAAIHFITLDFWLLFGECIIWKNEQDVSTGNHLLHLHPEPADHQKKIK